MCLNLKCVYFYHHLPKTKQFFIYFLILFMFSQNLVNGIIYLNRKTNKNEELSKNSTTVYIGYAHDYFGASKKLNVSSTTDEGRSKRGVLQLYNMLVCATGCNPVSYKGYGCYCGFLGSGYAVDGIDECCKMHDWCYSTVKCPILTVYFVPYLWYCYKYQPYCVYDTENWPSVCAQRLCECDRALSMCLQRYSCPRDRAMCYSSPWRLFQNAIMG